MLSLHPPDKRVILVHWKKDADNPFEVFSNLKNFCLSYNQFNYNTINNYLSKAKVPYENNEVRIERKTVILKPKSTSLPSMVRNRSMEYTVRKVSMKEADDERRDLDYWLCKSVAERGAAVTQIISQSLKKGDRMDKTIVVRKRIQS